MVDGRALKGATREKLMMLIDSASQLSDRKYDAVEKFREEVFAHYGGADIVATILNIDPSDDLMSAESDYVMVLSDIIHTLSNLCGSQQRGFEWLLGNESYRKVAGSYPFLALEYGGFWSMATMLDWLQIVELHRPQEFMVNFFSPDEE